MTKKHYLLIIVSLFVIVSFLFGSRFLFNDVKKNIKSILASESYSYLPLAAQQYIEDKYLETGELLLTEKNKEYNEYYLNPEFVDYLVSENQEDYEVIPNELVVDYVYSDVSSSSDLPSHFDLRNVNGKNFITPYKDQEIYGLCWSFATMEQAESYLLVKNNTTYNTGAVNLLSARHADYVTARDAIVDVTSPYKMDRDLTSGGSFGFIANYAVDGLSYVDESWIDYNSLETKLEYNKVFNYANSLYELNSTINMPVANLSEVDSAYKDEYLYRLKKAIMAYGGAYVATNSPNGTCSIYNSGNKFIYSDGRCSGTRHAMQIIGWDDNYSYSLCTNVKNSNNEYYISSNTSNCDGDVISGTGAWILRNSWGDNNKIVYLAYDSQRSDINVATDIDVKNWDNQYRGKGNSLISSSTDTKIEYSRIFDTPERIVKVKVELLSQNRDYNVYISSNGDTNNMVLVDTITSDLPGYYTINLYSKNIQIIGDKFIVEVKSSDGRMTSSSLNVYTSYLNDTSNIKTYDTTFINDLSSANRYRFRIESDTMGIKDNENITYKILYQSGDEIIPRYEYYENVVAANKVFSKLYIDGTLNKGDYILQTLYNGEVLSTSNLFVKEKLISIEGSGTKYDPYLITTPAQLEMIQNSSSAYFRLANDIDMTYDTQDPNGLFYNKGKGWNPLFSNSVSLSSSGNPNVEGESFSGSFDGNGNKIIGLYINRPDQDYVGLFSSMYNNRSNDMSIKNVVLEKPIITGRNYVGGVVGLASGYIYTSCLSLENIAIKDGKITGNSYVGGIAGYLQGGGLLTGACTDTYKKRFDVHSLFNSATIQANDNYAAGIFGYLTNYNSQMNPKIYIHDLQNIGIIYSQKKSSGLIAVINDNNGISTQIDNALSTGTLIGEKTYGIFSEYINKQNYGQIEMSHVYYSADEPFLNKERIYMSSTMSIYKKNAYELTNIEKWNDFDNYWVQKTINEKKRIPLLKIMESRFEYINTIDNIITINLDSEDMVNILDFIQPNIQLSKYNTYLVSNDVISVSPDGFITPNKKGQAILTIKSLYDGSEHSMEINVVKSPIVYFHSNFDNDVYQQTIGSGTILLEKNRFVRTGYTFKTWNTKPDGTGVDYQNQSTINITDDINLYAQWDINRYVISFVTNNETNINPIEITYGDLIDIASIDLKKDGYIFAGWYFDSRFSVPFNGTEIVSDNITLYAKWIENEFDVEKDTSYELINNYMVIPFMHSKTGLEVSNEYAYEVLSSSNNGTTNDMISTGDTIVIYKDRAELSRYNIVVLGDANGDGSVNSGDLYRVQMHLLNKKQLSGEYNIAADYNKDNILNSGDLYSICKYLIDSFKKIQ